MMITEEALFPFNGCKEFNFFFSIKWLKTAKLANQNYKVSNSIKPTLTNYLVNKVFQAKCTYINS